MYGHLESLRYYGAWLVCLPWACIESLRYSGGPYAYSGPILRAWDILVASMPALGLYWPACLPWALALHYMHCHPFSSTLVKKWHKMFSKFIIAWTFAPKLWNLKYSMNKKAYQGLSKKHIFLTVYIRVYNHPNPHCDKNNEELILPVTTLTLLTHPAASSTQFHRLLLHHPLHLDLDIVPTTWSWSWPFCSLLDSVFYKIISHHLDHYTDRLTLGLTIAPHPLDQDLDHCTTHFASILTLHRPLETELVYYTPPSLDPASWSLHHRPSEPDRSSILCIL